MGRKFSDEQLQLLLDQGLSQVEIARKFDVSKAAISLRVKRLKEKQDQDLCAVLEQSKTSELSTSLKDQLTEREIKFIENYLAGGVTVEKAMIAAGYVGYNTDYLYRLSRKIVQRYEAQAADHREIFRACGVGVARVAKKISEAMDKAKSETVQFNYTQLAAKALGITADVTQASQGLTIVIQAQGDAQTQVNVSQGPAAEPGSPGYEHPAGLPGKPIQISK
jgi:predicted DNA-binding protein YlxM (UPF0122 family)